MPVDLAHLRLHLERLQQAYGRELPVEVPVIAPRVPPRSAPRPAPSVGSRPEPAHPAAPARRPVASRPTPPRDPAPVPPPVVCAPGEDPLAALRAEVLGCTRCGLSERRRKVVFGEGNPAARILFIGEAPGATEDRTGRPFVGEAGQLLERILNNAMGLQRGDVFIANINKCRPPNNRDPRPDEVAACLPFLQEQVRLIEPEVIVCMGRVAAQNLLGRKESASRLRGQQLSYQGIPVVVTWHPAYLLREPSRKAETWEDIKRVNRMLGRPEVPPEAAAARGRPTRPEPLQDPSAARQDQP